MFLIQIVALVGWICFACVRPFAAGIGALGGYFITKEIFNGCFDCSNMSFGDITGSGTMFFWTIVCSSIIWFFTSKTGLGILLMTEIVHSFKNK